MVADRKQKNEIFNLPSKIENINEEYLHAEFINQLRNNEERTTEWVLRNETIIEYERIREQRREERQSFCDMLEIPCDDSILLMVDEEFKEFAEFVLNHFKEDVISYCHQYGITYEETLLEMPDYLFDDMQIEARHYYGFDTDEEPMETIIIDNTMLERVFNQDMLENIEIE